MSLATCIRKAGAALTEADRQFLNRKLKEGMSDEDALDALEHKVALDLQEVMDEMQVAGFDLKTDGKVSIIGTPYEKLATQIATGSESGQRTGPEAEEPGLTVAGVPPVQGWREATAITARGEPIRVFRGSRSNLTPEKFTQLGMNTGSPQSGLGVFFAAKKSDAKVFGDNIQEVYLDIRNPYVMTLKSMHQFHKQGYFNSLDNAVSLADMMRDRGHDGIIIDMREEEGNIHFVAFEPEQVIVIPRDIPGAPRADVIESRLANAPKNVRPFHLPAIKAAKKYAKEHGTYYKPIEHYVELDEDRARRIAQAYDEMKHDPNDPEVKAAYDAMIRETLAQFELILETGIDLRFTAEDYPYTNPQMVHDDVRNNNRMYVYPTAAGFGSDESFDPKDNPLLGETEYEINGHKLLVNDVFRVVHDYFGHIKNGVGFRAVGEENAWQAHAAMYSPLARRAMTVETRGQNSWLNFGPHGEQNRKAKTEDTIFADQKIGLLPLWASEEGRVSGEPTNAKPRMDTNGKNKEGMLVRPPVKNGMTRVVHFSKQKNLDIIDPEFYGSMGAGVERERAGLPNWVNRSYFGIEPGKPGGYKKEYTVGNNAYEVDVPSHLIYDMKSDPDGLIGKMEFPRNMNSYEKAIKDAGYVGYWVNDKSLGLVGALFEPVVVSQEKGYSVLYQGTDSLGFYSRIENAINDMKLPGWKKPDGTVKGKEIAAKLKSMGLKKVETDWRGTFDTFESLEAETDFTREEAVEWILRDRIILEETIGRSRAGLGDGVTELRFAGGWADEDESHSEFYEDNNREEWKHGGEIYFFDEDAQEDYAARYLEEEMIQIAVEKTGVDRAILDEKKGIGGEMWDYVEKELKLDSLKELREAGHFDDEFESRNKDAAYQEYMESPYYIYEAETNVGNVDIRIYGNTDTGYTVSRLVDGVVLDYLDDGDPIASLAEAQIQAETWARDMELLDYEPDADDPEVAQYEGYMDDNLTNYREVKLSLERGKPGMPNFSGSHFNESNLIVASLVSDRDLITGEQPELTPEQLADSDHPNARSYRANIEAEKEKLPQLFESEKNKLILMIQNSNVNEARKEQSMTKVDDYTAWEIIAEIHGIENYQNKYRSTQQQISRLSNVLEADNRKWNTREAKLRRAGYKPTRTYFIEEGQSDWATRIRESGVRELNEYESANLSVLLDQIRDKVVSEITKVMEKSKVPEGYSVSIGALKARAIDLVSTSNVNYEAWGTQDKWIMGQFVEDHWYALQAEMHKVRELQTRLREGRRGAPPMPFTGDGWLELMMKRAIIQAVEQGYDSIGWSNSAKLQSRWSHNYDYSTQYDRKMPSIVKKLLKADVVERDFNGELIERTPRPKIDTSGWTVEIEMLPPNQDGQRAYSYKLEIPEIGLKENGSRPLLSNIARYVDDQAVAGVDPVEALRSWHIKQLFDNYKRGLEVLQHFDIVEEPAENDPDAVQYYAVDQNGEVLRTHEGNPITFSNKLNMVEYLDHEYHKQFYPELESGYWSVTIPDAAREQIKAEGLPILQSERGRFYPGDQDNIIQLTKTSDLSTFVHEGSHLFLETQKTWAKKYGVTPNQQAILSYFRIANFDELTAEMHEKWAESFEVYLRTGEAPSLALKEAFAAFSRWLKKIYRTLTDSRLRRADTGDEITQIFDRLLATEEEINELASHPEYDQYFRSSEQLGMGDAAWKEYQRLKARVRDTAEADLDERVLKQYMKRKTEEWNSELKELAKEERAKLEEIPVYQLIKALRGDKANNIPAVPFDTAALNEMFPEGIPKKLTFLQKKEGGLHPDIYAEAFGYPSAKQMIDELLETPSITEAANELAEARMLNKYGDILNDGSLESEAREAMLNDDHARLLEMEIKASRKSPGINRTLLKSKAYESIAKMTFKEIQPARYYRAMVKAAKDSMVAENPTEAKTRQLLNHYLYREAVRVKEQMEKHRKYVRSMTTRKFDTKKIDPEYAQRMKMLAEMYDMRKGPEQIAKLSDILNFFAAQVQDAGGDDMVDLTMLDPNLVNAIEYRIHHGGNLEGFQLVQFDEMTAEDLHGVHDMLKHLSFVGRQLAEMNGEEATKERMSFVEWIRSKGGRDHPQQRGKQSYGKEPREKWNYLINTLPSLVNLIRKLDGMEGGGMAQRLLYQTISDANDRKMALNMRYYDRFERMVGDISKVKLSRRDATRFVLEDQQALDLSSEEIFMFALYWGTESSREALRQGHGVTDNDAQNIMSSLSEDQLKLVNAIWAMNETHWPDLQAAAIDMEGYAPPKLQATPFTVNGIQMTGGHMQLFYDSQRIDLKNEQEIGTRKGSVMPTKAGSLNARVGSGGQPVKLDINNITRSIDDKVHFIAFAQAGRKLRRLINHKDVVGVIERKHGTGFYQSLVEEIEAITSNRGAQETHKTFAAINRWMRSSATMMNLMYSIRNTAQQFSALPIAAKEVGFGNFAAASAKLLSERGEMVRFINEKSKFMENRAQVINRDSREVMKKMIATSQVGGIYEAIKARGFILQTLVDSTVAYPTWLAAYNRGMSQHEDEKRAQIDADTAVAESVGSGSDLHLGRVMQSNQSEIVKTLTIFGSWFNAYYQRLYRSSKGGTDFVNLDLIWDAIVLPIIAANIAQALILDMPDEKDDEDWYDWTLKNYRNFMLGTIPVVREIGSFFQGFTPSTPMMALPKAAYRMVGEAGSYAEGKQTGLKTTVDVGRAASSVLKIPGSGQFLRALEYIDSYMQGEEDGFNVYQMMVEGADKDD